jgi:dipeptidyl aminopeptidase/acylaminoacyl peptidase
MRSPGLVLSLATALIVALPVALIGALPVALIGACGGEPPQPPAAPQSARAAPSPPASVSAVSAGADVDAEPTVLTDAQKRRDAALAPRVRAILDVHQNFGAVLSPDGRQVLFRSDRGGVSELYLAEVARPKEPARKLAGGPERVASAVFTPDGKAVLFRQDTGADENFHILRVDIDGKGVTDLTPREALWRDHPFVPRNRPGVMVYSVRKKTALASSVVVQSLSGGDAKVVYADPSPATVVDISPDGARALLIRQAVGGYKLLEVDLVAGNARLLYPMDDQPARIEAAAYATDGKRVFVATDSGAESFSLLALDLKSLVKLAEYRQQSPALAGVGAVVPSPRGDRVAILVDAGNRSFVRLLDARTLALKTEVATPLGSATLGTVTEVRIPSGAGAFSADGEHFAIGLSLPDTPDDIYRVNTASGAIRPLRQEARASLAGLPAITTSIETITAFDGLTIPVNVYLPKDLAPARRLPTIVTFHGGPDASSAVAWSGWTRVYTAFGFAVLEPNIRGSTGFGRAYEMADNREKRADAIRDVESVNRWARAQRFCDPERLVIDGASYGGYIVLMGLTRQPALWAAGVDLVGISDLKTMLESQADANRAITEYGDLEKDARLLAEFSPLRDADRIVSPLFVYQGQNDGRVPRQQSDLIVRSLRQRDMRVEYMVAANEGHSIGQRENQVEFLTRVLRFLHDALHIDEPATH